MPDSFAPPHPKQPLVGFGSNRIVSLVALKESALFPYFDCLAGSLGPVVLWLSSNQSHATSLGASHPALTLSHFDFEQIRQGGHAPSDLLLVQASKTQPQGIRQRPLYVEVAAWRKQHAALFHMNQELAGIEPRRQLQPQAHSAFRPRPTRILRHVLPKRFIQRH